MRSKDIVGRKNPFFFSLSCLLDHIIKKNRTTTKFVYRHSCSCISIDFIRYSHRVLCFYFRFCFVYLSMRFVVFPFVFIWTKERERKRYAIRKSRTSTIKYFIWNKHVKRDDFFVAFFFDSYFVYLSEDDISTTCLHDRVLARSLTQFVLVLRVFPQWQRIEEDAWTISWRACTYRCERARARLYHLIIIKKKSKDGLMAGEQEKTLPMSCFFVYDFDQKFPLTRSSTAKQ